MFKKILFPLLLVFLLFPLNVFASEQFVSDANVEYKVLDDGVTTVTHNITIENLFTNIYVTSYALTLENITPENVRAVYKGRDLKTELTSEAGKSRISMKFDDSVVGKNKKREFQIVYNNSTFAQRTGEVWEISIPKLSETSDFRTYNLSLNVPGSFGLEAYISPKPNNFTENDGRKIYFFDKNDISKTGITAGFGAFQVFSFSIDYHLENPLSKASLVQIAVPPDTNLQKVYYSSISPAPENIIIDNDGNWLAEYKLKARERVDIKTTGSVQIFSGPRPFPIPTKEILDGYLVETEYWHINDPKITDIAKANRTPREIYDFVINGLTYSYEMVSPQSKREGSLNALLNPEKATCMEFTDLFIAIARAAGIPAREINGFAYTENPKIQPLSLINDVLHSWPEYWDSQKNQWVQIDPTWASTTGGIDYFNKLDLRHFAFVIHGQDPNKPYTPGSYKLGPNPQKDVFVNFGSLPEKRNPTLKLEKNSRRNFPFTPAVYEINLLNEGPSAIYNLKVNILFDSQVSEEKNIEILPPFASTAFEVKIPYSILGRNTPTHAKVVAQNSEIDLDTNKNKVIVDTLLLLLVLIFLVMSILVIRLRPKIILKIWYKIKNLFRKNNVKENKKPQETQSG